MKNLSRIALAGAFLALAACSKESSQAPASQTDTSAALAAAAEPVECKECNFEFFLGKEVPVWRIECTNPPGEEADHCHLLTERRSPERHTLLEREKDGSFSFTLRTQETGKEYERMDCAGLRLTRAKQLEGMCKIEPGDGPPEHYFRAEVVPLEEKPDVPNLRFRFQHDKFDDASDPVHNGEGHSHFL